MIAIHHIAGVHFEQDFMILHLDNEKLRIKLSEVSPKLAAASEILRNDFQISPSGYGIHWFQLDEDLSVAGLLKHLGKA